MLVKNILNKLKTIYKHPLVVVCLVVLGVFLIMPEQVFAQSSAGVSEDINGWIVNTIRLLSWLWIIPASIAGKLMTNSMAFGSAFYLDTYLFKIRQFMRTMALFALGFILVYKILVVFVKQEELKDIGKVIGKTALAGILIPMSWFMITILVDFSIVATSAVAGMPLQVMQQQRDEIDEKLRCYREVRVKANKTVDVADINAADNRRELSFEDVMPTGDSVAGPMIFMGCGMLNLFDFNNLSDTATDFEDIALYSGLKLIISFMLILPMIILMVVNMMRIFFIRLWAIFGPIIVLDTIFGGPLTTEGGAYSKYFKASNIIGLVFQPVAVVGMMSVSMVFLLGFYNGMTGDKDDLTKAGGVQSIGLYPTGNNGAQIGTGVNSEVHMDGSLFQRSTQVRVGGILGELIMAMLVIIVMRGLMKIGFQSSAITRDASNKMFELGAMGMKAVPFIPTGQGMQSFGSAKIAAREQKNKFTTGLSTGQRVDAERIKQKLGFAGSGLDPRTAAELEIASQYISDNPVRYFQTLKKAQKNHDIPWNEMKEDVTNWLSKGGYETLQNANIIFSASDQKPANMNTVWEGASGGKLTAWVNGIMSSSDLDEHSSQSQFFMVSPSASTRPESVYKKTGSSTD